MKTMPNPAEEKVSQALTPEEEHHREWINVLRDARCLNEKNQIVRWRGVRIYELLASRGGRHDKMEYEKCKCKLSKEMEG